MRTLWQKIFGTAAKSNETAKSRLHFVLVQDRTGLSSEDMASFREELVGVIQNYFEMEEDAFDISYRREGEETALVINSPVVRKAKKRNQSEDKEKETEAAPAASPA